MESCQTSPNNREKERFLYCKKDLRLLYFCLQGTLCCNYGADGNKIITASGGYDCLLIPGATLAGAIKPNKICGNNMGIINAAGETNATVCCKFVIDLLSSFLRFGEKYLRPCFAHRKVLSLNSSEWWQHWPIHPPQNYCIHPIRYQFFVLPKVDGFS